MSILVECHPTAIIYPNVHLGAGVTIGPYVIIGEPPRGYQAGQLSTVIGDGAVIRSHTIIYAGNRIGKHFQAGHGALLREENEIGDDVSVGSHTVIEHHVHIEDRVRLHSQVFVPEHSILEEGCWLGPNVTLTNVYHPLCPHAKECAKGATIRMGAKIGANVTLLPDIEIGAFALVGAGSVVTRSVEAGMVVAGNPARSLKHVRDLTCPYDIVPEPYPFVERTEVSEWQQQ